MGIRRWAGTAVLAAVLPGAAWGGLGMSTKFGMVTLENLQPGEAYNTRELASLPYVITNRSDVPLKIRIAILKPADDKGMARLGYEPIPDTSWVRLNRDELDVEPGTDAGTDVILTIPNDDRHLGKKYQVNLHATAKGPANLAVGLMSVLRFTVASRRPTPEELAQRKRIQEMGSIDFDLSPNLVAIEGVAVGERVDAAKAFKKTLRLSNPNDEALFFHLKANTTQAEEMGLAPGYEDAPDPNFLKLEAEQVKVEGTSIKKLKFYLEFPKDDKYRGKRFQFVVSAQMAGGPVVLRRISRILVSTKP